MDSGRSFEDLEPWWLPPDEDGRDIERRPAGRRRGAGAEVLMAAMLGLADALGYERVSPDTVEVAPAPIGNDDLPLDFGPLEPLD